MTTPGQNTATPEKPARVLDIGEAASALMRAFRRGSLSLLAMRDIYRRVPAVRGLFLIALVSGIILAFADVFVVLAALPLIGSVMGGDMGLPSFVTGLQEKLNFDLSASAGAQGVLGISLLIGGLIIREVASGSFLSLLNAISVNVVMRLREILMNGLLKSDFAYVDRLESGRIRQIVMNEIPQVGSFIRALLGFISGLLTLLFLLALMVYATPALLLMTAMFLPIFLGWKLFYTKVLYRQANKRVQYGYGLSHLLNEAIIGLRQLKLSNRQAEFGAELHETSRQTERARQIQFLLVTWEPLLLHSSALFLILALIWLAPQFGIATFTQVATFAFLLYRLMPNATQLSSNFNVMLVNEPSVSNTLDACVECDRVLESGLDTGQTIDTIKHIRIDDVSLRFDRRENSALSNVSIEAHRGQLIGIVGRSGAGKSSLIHILLAMYAPNSGRVLIDDHDIAEINRLSLRRAIGIVSQDVHLFNTTVREVISGGNRDLSDTDIVRAANQAGIASFIETLPAGYKTRVGERGMIMSGGQRQRLFLAQVLARRPGAIVFDEATSALDMQNEQTIFETIEQLRQDHICIVITHRVERLRLADRIYVLDAGRVVQDGTWDELSRDGGQFQELRRDDVAVERNV
jgi:ABC-type multidrug transport system fused ATPase/permease subunit